MANKQIRPQIALSLGGGGAKTFAHLGVFDAFRKHDISIDILVTCSAASVIGVLYAAGVSSEDIKKEFKRKRKWFYIARRSIFSRVLQKFIKEKKIQNIKDLSIPISIIAVDLKTGKEMVFDQGDPLCIPLGSSAFPGIWQPIKYQRYELIDGAVLNPDPADIARSKVGNQGIVISVTLKMEFTKEDTKGRFSTVLRSLYLLPTRYRDNIIKKNSDIIISPANGLKVTFRDWRETFVGYLSNKKIDDYYNKGFQAAEAEIVNIKKLIKSKSTFEI